MNQGIPDSECIVIILVLPYSSFLAAEDRDLDALIPYSQAVERSKNLGKPYYSIIVPIYNVKDYLNKCIDSVLSQTYSYFELILVDDGSTDGCYEICDERKRYDQRVVVIHKPNGGLVSARKAGAKLASGDYIICIDGDDWIDADFLKEASDIIAQSNPDLIVFGYYKVYGEKKYPVSFKKSRRYNRSEITKEVFPKLIYPSGGELFPNSLCAKVYKKELYLDNQLVVDDSICMGEDTACAVPYIANCNLICISDKCMYYYRQNPNAMTKVKSPLSWISPKLIDFLLREKMSKYDYDFTPQISMRTLHAVFNVGASQFYRNESFLSIAKTIQEHYSEDYIRKACNETVISNTKGLLIYTTVKYKIAFLLYLYSKVRKK